jgi:hypothetical protein
MVFQDLKVGRDVLHRPDAVILNLPQKVVVSMAGCCLAAAVGEPRWDGRPTSAVSRQPTLVDIITER